jgi:hypothetical protein
MAQDSSAQLATFSALLGHWMSQAGHLLGSNRNRRHGVPSAGLQCRRLQMRATRNPAWSVPTTLLRRRRALALDPLTSTLHGAATVDGDG